MEYFDNEKMEALLLTPNFDSGLFALNLLFKSLKKEEMSESLKRRIQKEVFSEPKIGKQIGILSFLDSHAHIFFAKQDVDAYMNTFMKWLESLSTMFSEKNLKFYDVYCSKLSSLFRKLWEEQS